MTPTSWNERSFTCVQDSAADAIVRNLLDEVKQAVMALELPGFRGLVLGGGYGRGEGGVTAEHTLYNDLDFFVFLDVPESSFPALLERLEPVSRTLSARVGIDVDFTLRTAARLRLDVRRLMVQELLRGHVVVAPDEFDLSTWAGVSELAADSIPVGEAARLLMNRGMGLLLAARPSATGSFVLRNINKAVLGAGDARLVAAGRYAWRLAAREAALGDALYAKACAFKRTPSDWSMAVATWTEARDYWRAAYDEIFAVRGDDLYGRSLYQAMRWLRRRRTFGEVQTFGMDCTTRVLLRVKTCLEKLLMPNAWNEETEKCFASIQEDWKVFN